MNQSPGKDVALNSDLDAFSFMIDRLRVHTAGFVAISLMILGGGKGKMQNKGDTVKRETGYEGKFKLYVGKQDNTS